MIPSTARPWTALAAVLALLAGFGLALAAAVGDRIYRPELGLFAITLPAGTSYVVVPLVPVDSLDPLDVFGPEVLTAESIESFDPATRQFRAYFPTRPGDASGEQRLFGNVLRISVRNQTTLSIRGTPSQISAEAQLAAGVDLEFLGVTTVDPLGVRQTVDALERTGRFRFGSNPLEAWNLVESRWDPLSREDLEHDLLPATALRLADNAGPEPPPEENVAYLPSQVEQPLHGAGSAGETIIDVASYPLTGTAPAAPFPLSEHRFRTLPGGAREGIGRLLLPPSLRAMTDLPATVPVLIHYSSGANPVPVRFEVLSIFGLRAGGQVASQALSANGSVMDLSVTTSGVLYGYALAPLPAQRDGGSGPEPTVLTSVPVSIYFQNDFTAPVLDVAGRRTLRTGPVLDIAHSLGPDVRVFRRVTQGLSAPVPGRPALTETAPGVFIANDLWLEYRPAATAIQPAVPGAWAPFTVPAVLRSADGASVGSVDARGVTSAAVRFSWMPPSLESFQAIVAGDLARTATFTPGGNVILPLAGPVLLRARGADVSFVFEPPSSNTYELEISPVAEVEAMPQAGTAGTLDRFTLKPIVRFLARDIAQTASLRFERLLLQAQPQAGGTLDTASLFESLSALTNALGGQAAGWGRVSAHPLDLQAEFQQIREALDFDRGGLSVALASAALMKDSQGAFTKRLTLDASGDVTWAAHAAGTAPSFAVAASGAYEDVGNPGATGAAVTLELGRSHSPGESLPSESLLFAIDGQFQLPESWGLGTRMAAGQWAYHHQRDPTGRIVNRGRFRASGGLAFRSPLAAVPGLDWLETGPTPASFAVNLAGIDASLEAVQQGAAVSHAKRVSGSLSASTAGANPEEEAGGKSLTIGLTLASRAAGSPGPETAPPAGSPGFLTSMFGGPSIFDSGIGSIASSDLTVQFQGFETDFLRLDSAEASRTSSQTLGLQVQAGFRFRSTDPFTQCVGELEMAGSARTLDLSVDGIQISRASPGSEFTPDFALTDAHARAGWSRGGTGPLGSSSSLLLGGNLEFSGGLLEGANLEIAADADISSKLATVSGELTGPLFCEAGDDLASCPIKSGSVRGQLDLSGSVPRWALELSTVFRPPWLDTPEAAVAEGRIAGTGNQLAFHAALSGVFPKLDFPPEVGGQGGSVAIRRLGFGYDAATRLWSYEGEGRLTLPDLLRDIGSVLTLPADFDIDVSGVGPRLRAALDLSPPPELAPLEGLNLKFLDLAFTRLGKWTFSMKTLLKAPKLDVQFDTSFDAALKLFRLVPPAGSILSLSLDAASLAIQQFSIDIFKDVSLGGAIGFRLNGLSTFGLEGLSFSGLTAISVDALGNFRLALAIPPGVKLSALNIPGFQITPKTLSLSSLQIGLKREFSFGIATSIKLDDPVFGPLNGLLLEGLAKISAAGDLDLTIDSTIGPLRLGLPGGPQLPFEITVDRLGVRKPKFGPVELSGDCKVSVLRPLNSFFGAFGDTPFHMNARLGVKEIAGRRKLFFAGQFTPPLTLPFELLLASGTLTIPAILLSSEGDLSLDATLSLRQPVYSVLSLFASVDAQKRASFGVRADPRLTFDLDLLEVDFSQLGYREAFPGFMGVFADFAFKAGSGVNRVAADVKDLIYILPSSLPPNGFPFFEQIDASLSFLGFGGGARVALPAPRFTFEDGVQFASRLSGALTNDTDSAWNRLRDFLSDKLSGDRAAFKGPGVGDFSLVLPGQLSLLFPDLPRTAAGLKLVVFEGMKFGSDFFPGAGPAEAIVRALRVARLLLRVVTDPGYLIELVPEEYRSNEIAFTAGGLASARAAYSLVAPVVQKTVQTEPLLGRVAELCRLFARLEDPSVLPPRADVEAAAAAGRSSPALVQGFSISGVNASGGAIEGTVTDSLSALRGALDRTLELARTSGSDTGFDVHRALVRHLAEIATREGGSARFENGKLVSQSGRALLAIEGLSPVVVARLPNVTGAIFSGQVPLARTTVERLPVGELTLTSVLRFDGRALVSEVSGSVRLTGQAPIALGTIVTAKLADAQIPDFRPETRDGSVSEWTADYSIDAARATFTHLGTVKFVSPSQQFTTVLPGASFTDIRNLLSILGPFREAIFDQDASPYALGLKVWALLRGDPVLSRLVKAVKADGRTVSVSLADPVTGVTSQVRIVLEDLAYYLAANRDPESSEVVNLEGESRLSNFRVEGDRLLAQPFEISLGGETAPVPNLVIFDAGAPVRALLDRSRRQQQALLQTDLSQFVSLGLTVAGDPMIVRSLRIEVDSGGVRAIARPKSVELVRLAGNTTLVRLRSGAEYDRWRSQGPDSSKYPSQPGRYELVTAGRELAAESLAELHRGLKTDIVMRTVRLTAPSALAGTFQVLGPGEYSGVAGSIRMRPQSGKTELDAGGVTVTRGKDGQLSGSHEGKDIRLLRTDAGDISESFELPDIVKKAGSLNIDFRVAANLSVASLDFSGSGSIFSDGKFLFEGGIDITLLGTRMNGARFKISSTDGIEITGKWGYLFFEGIAFEGKVRPSGHTTGKATARYLFSGTGIDGKLFLDTNANPIARVVGDLRVFGRTLQSGELKVDRDGFGYRTSLGGGGAGVSLDLKFKASSGPPYLRIDAGVSAFLDVGVTTLRLNRNVGVGLDGSIDLEFGDCVLGVPAGFTLKVNISRLGFSIRSACD